MRKASSLPGRFQPLSWRLATMICMALIAGSLSGQDLQITEAAFQPNGHFQVRLASDGDHYYRLLRSAQPDTAFTACDIQLSGGASSLLQDQAPLTAAGFYQVEEIALSAPSDSDGDGMPDTYELNHRPALSPLNPADALEDPDGDGRTNQSEYLGNTDPLQAEPDEGVAMPLPRLAAGNSMSAALRADGTLWTWGTNYSGALGNGTLLSQSEPRQAGTNSDWIAVSTGYSHLVALRRDGTLWGCGRNAEGQLGDGTTNNSLVLVPVATFGTWKAVTAGYTHTLAIRSDGTLWGWGASDSTGLLEAPDFPFTSTPSLMDAGTNWIAVAAAINSIALKADGTLWGWGAGSGGNPAAGGRIGHDSDWRSIATGLWFQPLNWGIRRDGSLWKWGSGLAVPASQATRMGDLRGWRSVSGWGLHFLACRSDGTVWSQGHDNAYGQLGVGDQAAAGTLAPTEVTDCLAVAAGRFHSMALRTDGVLVSWGDNAAGQLGYGGTNSFRVPQRVGEATNWTAVATGEYHTTALQTDGSLWTWGLNDRGQLGLGERVGNRNGRWFSPQRIGTNTNWKQVAAGDYHTSALQTDGSLWAWGLNANGRLGNGTTQRSPVPIAIQPQITWLALTAGGRRTMALQPDGSLWAWGEGYFGLGDGSFLDRTRPVKIGTNLNWTDVQIGGAHAMALQADGSLWGWGINVTGAGAVGAGPQGYVASPILVGTNYQWKAVALDGTSTMAIRSDSSLWAWGNNSSGQLGDGTLTSRSRPVHVGTDTNWTTIAMGERHSLAIRADGTLWAWGENNDGQLGTGGKTTGSTTPVQVGTEGGWKAIAGGEYHSVAIREDGTLWAWGRSSDGQLGQFAPRAVMGGAVWGNLQP